MIALAVSVVLVASFALIGVSLAGASHSSSPHYHCSVVCHGMVHGSSVEDFNWHARVEAGGNTTLRYCAAYEDNFGPSPDFIGSSTVYGLSGTCNYWASGSNEGVGWADSYAESNGAVVLSHHAHPYG
jgi:hypothetical protein